MRFAKTLLSSLACAAAPTLAGAATTAPAVAQLTLPASVPAAMILVAPARSGSGSSWLEANGVVVPDARSIQDVNAYVTGEVREVFVRVGDRVKSGTPIVSIDSPEFVTTQRSYLALLANEEQKQVLHGEGRLANYTKDARENLKWWGMSEAQVGALEREHKLTEKIVLKADREGVISQVLVEPGALINAGDRSLKAFVVTGKAVARILTTRDPLRIEGYVYPDQLPLLHAGTALKVQGPDGKVLARTISEVLPDIDPATQRGRFRADLGPASPFAPGTALRLSVQLARAGGTWIPREAVLSQRLAPVVYVRTAPQRYERRRISVLAETVVELQVSGVQASEAVVTAGKNLLEGAFRMGQAPALADVHRH
jgi:multidrug efflux pump subunit AcrA (membrane-fusion protein)